MSGTPSPSPPPSNTTYVKVACHCGLNEFRAGFPTDALPISNDLCHCSSCRHSSGQMAVYHVNVVSLLCADTNEPFHVDGSGGECVSPGGDGDLVPYQTSENAVRYFCSTCSAHLIFRYLGKPSEEGGEREGAYWCVAAGALERTEGIVEPGYHIYTEDTLDGGLADHLRSIGHLKLPRYRRQPGSELLPLGWKATKNPEGVDDNTLHFACHCKTLQFKITRPNVQSTLPHAAFPDLLYPYDITHLAKLRNSGDVKWWLRPLGSSEPTKYFAGHCACTYCRLTSGFEIQSWVYVPRGNILDMDGQPIALQEVEEDELTEVQEAMKKLGVASPSSASEESQAAAAASLEPAGARMPGLKQYISSPGRYRESCHKCGATAFAWQVGRPDLICVAVALVDETQDGARAESWFDWCLTRVGFIEQAVSPMTVGGLAAGLKAVKEEKESGKSVDNTTSSSDDDSGATTILVTPASSLPVDAIAGKDRTSVAFTLVEEVVTA